MKHLKFTFLLVIAVVITILYLLQGCGGVHYNSYVEEYKDIAIEEMIRTGYPASIKLAQAILESEGGRSELAIDHNNHFGILCDKKWKGQKYHVSEEDFATGERFESCYKIFDTPAISFIAHTNLLKKDAHYKSLFQLKSSNYVLWAEQLMELGYTNNETYDLTLINMIEKYNLDSYDDIALGYDPEYADHQDGGSDEYIPSTFDHQDDDLVDRIREKKDRTRINIEDHLSSLNEDIADHRSEFLEDRASLRREIEEQLDHNYGDRKYHNSEHPTYQTRAERYNPSPTPTPYNGSNKRQSSARDAMDAKYKDLHNTDYPNRNAYKKPIKQPYAAPNNRRRSTYNEASTPDEDNWLSNPIDEVGTSDFADDYTYINGAIVVYARSGDSPLTIAKRYNVSVKDIVTFNEAVRNNTQLLKEGKAIYLEAKKKNYLNGQKYHTVQTGERMEDIAAMYGLLLNELYEKNRMPIGSQPGLGEDIKLDRGKTKRTPELRSNYKNEYQTQESIAPPSSVAIDNYKHDQSVTTVLLHPVTNQKYHTVQAGETLYSIAQTYGLSPDLLMRLNGLTSKRINKEMRLIIR